MLSIDYLSLEATKNFCAYRLFGRHVVLANSYQRRPDGARRNVRMIGHQLRADTTEGGLLRNGALLLRFLVAILFI